MEYWKVSRTDLGIVITCKGHDREGTVGAAVTAFHVATAAQESAFTIIADLREMTGYETPSRKAWQEAFKKSRSRIKGLILVGARSALIRMGAAAVGAYAGVPVTFVAAWDEIDKKMPRQVS